MKDCSYLVLLLLLLYFVSCISAHDKEEPHPDPNEENYKGMIYIGRHHNGTRVGFDEDNGIKYIFGTSFDDSHKEIEEEDLHHEPYNKYHHSDLADRSHPTKTREEVLREQRHKPVSERGPKPFGHVGTYFYLFVYICCCLVYAFTHHSITCAHTHTRRA